MCDIFAQNNDRMTVNRNPEGCHSFHLYSVYLTRLLAHKSSFFYLIKQSQYLYKVNWLTRRKRASKQPEKKKLESLFLCAYSALLITLFHLNFVLISHFLRVHKNIQLN